MEDAGRFEFSYRGVIPILPTPFHDDESLDLESVSRLVEFCQGVGITTVTVLGVLGEASSLTDREGDEVTRTAVSHGVSVIVGASRPAVAPTLWAIDAAADAGARAVMIAPPPVDGMGEDAVFGYFAAVAADSALPVIVQDHPASTKVHMPVRLLTRLVEELGAVAGVKCESVPAAPKIRALLARTGRVPVLTGLGALYGTTDLAAGAGGFNTGFAFPEVLTAMCAHSNAGDTDAVRRIYQRFLPLIVFEQQPGPAIRKEVWRRRGVLTSASVRQPAFPVDEWMAGELTAVMSATLRGVRADEPLQVD